MDLFLHPKLFRILRFLISGGLSAIVNLGSLYVFTEYVGFWYIVSACFAFLLSFGVSFTLQKFWTFRDRSVEGASRQAAMYLFVAIINFVLNISLLFFLVEFFHLHYLLAEMIVMVVIACVSFFVYRNLIFRKEQVPVEEEKEFFLSFSHALILLASAVVAALLPFAILTYALGEPPQLPVAFLNEADYYYDRMQEIKDGYPLLGNPYFFEHREDPPPAFVGADWLASVPLLIGIPLMQTIVLNIFGWSLIFLLFAYALVRAWGGTPAYALFGALLTYTESYSFMLRPVSMQVVFPFFLFFLTAYLLWLRDPKGRVQQLFFGISAALAASLYTYTWQIIVVVFPLTFIGFLLVRRENIRTLLVPALLFVVLTLPFMIITFSQSSHPHYAETLARIGLIKTHLPIFLGFVIALVPLIVGVLAFIVRRERNLVEWLRTPAVQFFIITGTAIIGVMLSNIITGLDLELPQHLERFVILWFVFASVYFAPQVYERFRSSRTVERVGIAILVALVIGGHVHYQKTAGIAMLLRPLNLEEIQSVQELSAPLAWLEEHAPESSVIWSDPSSRFPYFIAMTTSHYSLLHKGGGLHLVSDREMEDRYVTAHYFGLTVEELIRDHHIYAGTGNAIHPYKTHNRKVLLCTVLRLESLGYTCGEMTDAVSFIGEDYFDDLFRQYTEMRPKILEQLAEYHVAYIVADKKGNPGFAPQTLAGAEAVYEDDRFTIYRLTHSSENP